MKPSTFNYERFLELLIGLVECQATPDEDLVHRAALEIIAALRESQRREKAAVGDLEGAGACFTCKHFGRNGGECSGAGKCRVDGIEIFPCNKPGVYRIEVPDDGRNTYDWRGPADEKGEKR